MKYSTDKGTIYSEGGLPFSPRWFCDGRVAFQADNNGLADINYFNRDTFNSYITFHKRFWAGLYFYLKKENINKRIRFDKCEILPFGFKSVNDDCEFSVYTANDMIYITVIPFEDDYKFNMEFYDEYCFHPDGSQFHDVRYGGKDRQWSDFELKDNCLIVSYTEDKAKTYICFSNESDLKFEFQKRNRKKILSANLSDKGKKYIFAIGFSADEFRSCENAEKVIEEQKNRYKKVADRAPVLISPHDELNRYFSLAPMYHESLKTTDVKGAIRAQSTHYWVWGWDSMTSSESSLYWGDCEFIGEMLDCMEKYSDPEKGIAHAFNYGMGCGGAAAPPAQGMYITMLDNYRLAGGDYMKHYDFAKKLVGTIYATEVRDTGLCKGTSLYPDYRGLINESGNDISAFNNTVSYCAVRSMEAIAKAAGDSEEESKAKAFADRLQKNFSNVLFNKRLKFYDSSSEADTYENRNVPSNNAVKWENDYCADLIDEKAKESLEFYKKNFVSPAGLKPIPAWCDRYDADSNQLSCWWPVMSEFYTRLVNKFDEAGLMEQYVGWVEYWTKRLMCPEGIPCYDDNAEVPFDNWNCLSGIWHGYSIRGFYNAVIHSYVGVDFTENGMNLYPYSGDEVELLNLHFGARSFDIKMCGSGKIIEKVVLNGKNIGAVSCIPYDIMKDKNTVTVYRAKV